MHQAILSLTDTEGDRQALQVDRIERIWLDGDTPVILLDDDETTIRVADVSYDTLVKRWSDHIDGLAFRGQELIVHLPSISTLLIRTENDHVDFNGVGNHRHIYITTTHGSMLSLCDCHVDAQGLLDTLVEHDMLLAKDAR